MLHLMGLVPSADSGRLFTTDDLGVSRIVAVHTSGASGVNRVGALNLAIALRFFQRNNAVVADEPQPNPEQLAALADFVANSGGFVATCELCAEVGCTALAKVIHTTKDYVVAYCSTCDGLDGPEGIAGMPEPGQAA